MDDSTFVITGAYGQLGTALRKKYPNAKAVDADKLDITDIESVRNFDWSGITTILNAAAYVKADDSQTQTGRVVAWQVNAVGVRNLAGAALQHNLTLVHVSTDYVFDGTQDNHTEEEPFSPLNVYGQSKSAGDLMVSLIPKHYILRTSWVVGEGKNFVRTMLELGHKGVTPTVVADQVGRLTFTGELVRIIDHLLTIHAPYGTYNATNDGKPDSWANVTREIFKIGKVNQQVIDTTTKEYFASKQNVAPRPLKSTLDLSKLHATGFISHDWHEDLEDYIRGIS